MTTPKCPACQEENLAVEKRPDGDARCLSCGWNGPYARCFEEEKPEKQPREIRDRG